MIRLLIYIILSIITFFFIKLGFKVLFKESNISKVSLSRKTCSRIEITAANTHTYELLHTRYHPTLSQSRSIRKWRSAFELQIATNSRDCYYIFMLWWARRRETVRSVVWIRKSMALGAIEPVETPTAPRPTGTTTTQTSPEVLGVPRQPKMYRRRLCGS